MIIFSSVALIYFCASSPCSFLACPLALSTIISLHSLGPWWRQHFLVFFRNLFDRSIWASSFCCRLISCDWGWLIYRVLLIRHGSSWRSLCIVRSFCSEIRFLFHYLRLLRLVCWVLSWSFRIYIDEMILFFQFIDFVQQFLNLLVFLFDSLEMRLHLIL